MQIGKLSLLAFLLVTSFSQMPNVQGSIWWSLFKVDRISEKVTNNQHEIVDVYLKSKEKFQNFENNLKLDETKKKEERVRQIVKQFLGGRVGDASVLTDFYTPYF
jgi:hypothetical protein